MLLLPHLDTGTVEFPSAGHGRIQEGVLWAPVNEKDPGDGGGPKTVHK